MIFFLLSAFIFCTEPQKKLQRVCSADFQVPHGESFSLRPVQSGDKTAFDALTGDVRVKRFLPSGLNFQDHWNTAMQRLEQGHPAAGFALMNKGKFVGYALLGLEYAQKHPGTASPLLIIHPDYHGKGVGTAVREQVEILARKIAVVGQSDPAFHFGEKPLQRIISTCAESNIASKKLLTSGGFKQILPLNSKSYGGRPTLWFEKEVGPRSKL